MSLADASWIASIKGLVSGIVNLALALALGAETPLLPTVGAALILGLLSYGISLVFFVVALRHLARHGLAPIFRRRRSSVPYWRYSWAHR